MRKNLKMGRWEVGKVRKGKKAGRPGSWEAGTLRSWEGGKERRWDGEMVRR